MKAALKEQHHRWLRHKAPCAAPKSAVRRAKRCREPRQKLRPQPKLGLQPKLFGEACYALWQGGHFINNDEPQGNQVQEVVNSMRAATKEAGSSKLFCANITAEGPNDMIALYVLLVPVRSSGRELRFPR